MSYPIPISKIKQKIQKKIKRTHSVQNVLFFEDTSNVKEITNEFGEKLTRVDGTIPRNLNIAEGERFLFISFDQTRFSHGIHKYPAKFFPELPRWLVKKYSSKGDLVLDPFMGSATTNIECLLNKRHSVGIDVDPFARLLAKVKTTPLNEHELAENNQYILKEITNFQPKLIKENDLPQFPYRDNWFKREILKELTFIKQIVNRLNAAKDLKDFYRICFSSIIRSVSNADNNCTRTVVRKKLNKKIYPSFALTKFAENLLIYSSKMTEFAEKLKGNAHVDIPIDHDAKNIRYRDNYFDLAITSPPYLNAVDYPRTHQLEMYWLGLATGSLVDLKRKHVGTETVLVKDYRGFQRIGIKIADDVISEIYEVDPRRAYICYKYLNDMNENMKEIYRTLKEGGRYVIVVGNNRVRKRLFETWRYLMSMAEDAGFSVETYFGSEIIKHFIKVPRRERINTDWVIVLKK